MSEPENRIKIKDKVPLNLAVIFITLSIGIVLLGIYYYYFQKENIITQQENELTTISDYKTKQIELWLNERIKHANSILKNKHRISETKLCLDDTGSSALKENTADWFRLLIELYDYKNVTLYDNNFNQLLTIYEDNNNVNKYEIEYLKQNEPLNGVKISELYQVDSTSPAIISVFIPLRLTTEGKIEQTATIVFELDLQTFLFPLLSNLPTRHSTMESLIAQKKDEHVLFLNELKFRQKTTLRYRIPLTQKEVIAVQATESKEGILYGKDYRGEDVLASVRKIKGSSWFLITKIDIAEINAPILKQTSIIFLSVLLGIIIAGIIIALIWRDQRARHYRSLYQKEVESKAIAEHYAYLSKYANDLILLYDKNLNIIEANDRAIESFGYKKEELLKLNVKDVRKPGEIQNINKNKELLEQKGGIIFETELVRKDGSIFPAEVSTRVININGEKYYQSIIRDITERKKNEEIIRKNEILTHALIHNSPVGITIRDLSGKLIDYNKAWMDIWDLDDNKVNELEEYSRGKTTEERYGYFGKYLPNIKAGFEKGENQFIPEIKVNNPYSGKEIWLSIYLYALKSNGNIERIVTLTQDITEQKQTESRLKESEEKHRTIIEHSTVLFYSHTPDHNLTYMSPQTREYFDCEPEEALVNWTSLATGNPINELGYYLTQKAIDTGEAQPPYELELKGKTGRIIWVEVHESPIVVNGKTAAIVGSLTDITSRKKAEERIYKLNRIYRVLSEINQVIVRIKNENELFEQVCSILVELGNFKMVWIAEFDTDTSAIKSLAAKGHNAGYTDILISYTKEILNKDEPFFRSLNEKKVLVFNNMEDELLRPWRKESIKRGYGSYCIIPLLKKSKRNIVLNLYAGESDFFNKEEIELLTELAEDISFSLSSIEQENLRIEAESSLKTSKQQLQTLYETSESLNRTLNIEDTYKVIIDFVSKFMDCEGLVVAEYNSKEQKIYYTAAWIQGVWSETSNIPPIDLAPEGKGILSRVIRSGKSLILNDYVAELEKSKTKFRVDEKGKTYDINSERKDNTRSALMVPLKIEGKVIGVLHIISFKKNAYTEEHMKLLESISVHISSAINNSTLYRLAREEINVRRKTEEELRRSEERFFTIFKLNPVATLLTRAEDGKIIDINEQCVSLLGYTYEEVINKTTAELNAWTDYSERSRILNKLADKKYLKDVELKLNTKNGEIINTLTLFQFLSISGEKCILAIITDVTQKKKSEEMLRKLSSAVDQSPASILITDTDGSIEYVNSKFTGVTGYCHDEVLGKNPRILKSGETPDEVYKELWHTISTGSEWHGELHNKKKNGELFWEWASISPIFDSAGNITNYLAVKEDITVQKIIQEQILLQATLLQNIHDAVIYVDKNYKIRSWNDGAQSIYGWQVNEAIDKVVSDLTKTEYYDTDFESIVSCLKDFGAWKGEILQYTKDNKKINILSSASSIKDKQNHLVGIIIVNKDITERKQSEEKIKTSLKEKEILLKEIHHRVKNNLQVISSLLKMQSAYIKDPAALDYFKISSQRVKSMALIHEQLYRSADLSSIDFQSYIKKLTTHLFQTYGINTNAIRMHVNVKDIRLGIDTAIPCGLLVNELISNALKHAFPEKQKGKIEVEMVKDGKKYVLIVRDTGSGFPDDVDYKNTETLGMQLVNTLVEQINGKIELKKENGTEFTITFKADEYKERI